MECVNAVCAQYFDVGNALIMKGGESAGVCAICGLSIVGIWLKQICWCLSMKDGEAMKNGGTDCASARKMVPQHERW